MTARELVEALGGRWHGSYAMTRCPVPSHGSGKGDRNPSLKVMDGNDGEIVVHCYSGCPWEAVKDELRCRGLVPEFGPSRPTPGRPSPKPRQEAPREPDRGEQRRIDAARQIWRRAQPIAGTIGELYLRQRGI